MKDPRKRTREWAAEHPVGVGLLIGSLFYLLELAATADPVGTIPFALVICAIFTLTAYGERRRRRKKLE
jgi:hypothetical protein